MFLGEHQHTLDDKGRVILPAKFRDRLSGGLVLVPGPDRCIDVYPRAEFERRVEEWRALPREGRDARAYVRTLLAQAFEEIPDGQGRVTVPQRLREYAGLDRDLTVNGADYKLEVWDRERWEGYRAGVEEEFVNLDGIPSL